MNQAILDKYTTLSEDLAELSDQSKAIRKEMKTIEGSIIDFLESSGESEIDINGETYALSTRTVKAGLSKKTVTDKIKDVLPGASLQVVSDLLFDAPDPNAKVVTSLKKKK